MLASVRDSRWWALALRWNLPLVAIVLAAFVFSTHYVGLLDETAWLVQTDELLHVRLSISIGDLLSLRPRIHDQPYGAYSQLYPLLIAPVYQLWGMPEAHAVARIFNSALMASTAVPVYQLAREVRIGRVGAWFVAALTVFVPWMVMADMMMTEVVAYPVFVWAVLAIYRTVVMPSAGRDLVALIAIVVAFMARTQLALLLVVLPASILVHEVGWQLQVFRLRRPLRSVAIGLRSALAKHKVVAAGCALGAAVLLLRLGGPRGALGNYNAVTAGDLLPPSTGTTAVGYLAVLALAIGVLPFVLATAWAVSTLVSAAERRRHAFAVLLVIAVPLVVVQAASFTLRFSGGQMLDRYAFYVVPLLFVGMALCLGERRTWPAIVAGGLLFAWLAKQIPGAVTDVPGFVYVHSSAGQAFHAEIDHFVHDVGDFFGLGTPTPLEFVRWGSVVLAAGTAALVARRAGTVAVIVVGALMLAFCVWETRFVFIEAYRQQSLARVAGDATPDGAWIDAAVPEDANVGLVPSRIIDLDKTYPLWWGAEFSNRSVTRTYYFAPNPTYTPFPVEILGLDFDTGRLALSHPTRYLVVGASLAARPYGRTLATSRSRYLQLIRLGSPAHAQWATHGFSPLEPTAANRRLKLRLYARPGAPAGERHVTLTLRLPRSARPLGPRRYEISADGRTERGVVNGTDSVRETLSLCVPAGGSADVEIVSAPASARDETADARATGMMVAGIRDVPGTAACRVES